MALKHALLQPHGQADSDCHCGRCCGACKPEKHTTCSRFAADMTLLQDQLGEAIAALCVFGFLVPANFVSAVPGLKHASSRSSFG